MKPITFICAFVCLLAFNAPAAINPLYKECMQRGYQLAGDYCIFPDSSRCLLEDFNEQRCGEKWFTQDYCIPKGSYVWDEERCCDGLMAYLPAGISGQATCQPKNKVVQDQLTGGGAPWYLVLILILLGALLLLRFQQNKNRRKG